MPSLRDFTGQTLQWKRPRFFSTTYQLRVGDQVLATLSRAGLSRATAEAEGQQWIFQREGQRKVLAYPGNSEKTNEPTQPLASIQPGWGWQGDLTCRDGRVYTWARNGNWRPTWSWKGPDEKVLLTFKGRSLTIAPAASDLPDLAFLALCGFYLTLLREDEDTAVAAASVVVSS